MSFMLQLQHPWPWERKEIKQVYHLAMNIHWHTGIAVNTKLVLLQVEESLLLPRNNKLLSVCKSQ